MNARIPLGIAVPQTFLDGRVDTRRIRDVVQRAEQLGFESAWVVEQILSRISALEPVELLTWVAAHTTRLRLGAAVLLSGMHYPAQLAKRLATLDQLCDGRLDVGVGLGNTGVWVNAGLPVEGRADRFAEGVQLVKRLWTEPRVTFKGRFFELKDVAMEPKPRQRPHPPLWFGGHHPNALRRAVQMGDAFMGAGSASTAEFAAEMKILRGLLAEAGRDPAAFPVGKRVYIAVDADAGRAAARLAEWFAAFYGRPELAAEVSVWGDAKTCRDRLAEVLDAGARSLLLNPVYDEGEQLERLAELAPKL
jgi:probable F420-dependent oxidoreductase